MIRRIMAVLIATVIACAAFCGCTQKDSVCDATFEKAIETYISFMETAMENWQRAVEKYCYFGSDEDALRLPLTGTPLHSYKIIRVERISDDLWEIISFTVTTEIPDGLFGATYVALIDGEYRICTNLSFVPGALLEGHEIEPYKPHGPGVLGEDADIIGTIVE